LLNVILFPKTGCDRTGAAWNPVWIAVHWRRAFALQLVHPPKFTGLVARTNTAARTFDAPTELSLTKDSSKTQPTIQAMAHFTIAYLIQTQ
jgi:hypothetical protein